MLSPSHASRFSKPVSLLLVAVFLVAGFNLLYYSPSEPPLLKRVHADDDIKPWPVPADNEPVVNVLPPTPPTDKPISPGVPLPPPPPPRPSNPLPVDHDQPTILDPPIDREPPSAPLTPLPPATPNPVSTSTPVPVSTTISAPRPLRPHSDYELSLLNREDYHHPISQYKRYDFNPKDHVCNRHYDWEHYKQWATGTEEFCTVNPM